MPAIYSTAFAALLALYTLVVPVTASCQHGTSLQRRVIHTRQEGNVTEKTVQVSDFGYLGLQGPINWAGLAADNSACATSTVQSPIDLTNEVQRAAPGSFQMNIPDVAATELENLGTNVEVLMEGKGASTTVGSDTFELKQFHLHTPSEHRINGEYFPLEMHMVHEGENGAIVVIAVLFELRIDGSTTELLSSAFENIEQIATPGSVTETGALNFADIVSQLQGQEMFEYAGSLTTPPCAEGLTFYVTSQPLSINVETFIRIKTVVKFNSRITQNTLGQVNLVEAGAAVPAVNNVVCSTVGAEGGAAMATATATEAVTVETKAAEAPAAMAPPAMAPPAMVPASAHPVVVVGHPVPALSVKVSKSHKSFRHRRGESKV